MKVENLISLDIRSKNKTYQVMKYFIQKLSDKDEEGS